MKLYVNDLNLLLSYIENKTIRGLLLYGPDRGYITSLCDVIQKKFNFLKTTISYSNLKAQQLSLQLNTKNFFSQRELLQIQGVSGIFNQDIKHILAQEMFHFPIFIGEDIAASNSIRKFFENEKYLAAIGCYYDEKNITKLIAGKLKSWQVTKEATEYLKANLAIDYQYIQSELNKLALYAQANELYEIDFTVVTKVISTNSLFSSDDMCAYFALRKPEQFLSEAEKISSQAGFNEITVIRALLRFYTNIYIVNSKVMQGENIDHAIKTLLPPIFFKSISSFKQAAQLTSIYDAIRIINLLQLSEKYLKNSTQIFDFFTQIYLPAHKLLN